MAEIPIYRGSGYTSKGDWWTPNLSHAENYKHGPLAGKISKSKISLEDFKKGVEKANTKHKAVQRYLAKKYPLEYDKRSNRPSAVELRKQFDLDYKNMPLDEFKKKYYEAILPNQPYKIDLKNTLKTFPGVKIGKTILNKASKFAGPLAIPLTVYDYFSGSPAGEGSQLDNTIDYNTMVYTDGPLAKKKR